MQVMSTTSLAGTWRNQLGSTLTIEVERQSGLRGTFQAAVGSIPDKAYPLAGFVDTRPFGQECVFGFVVDWTDSHSVTVWTGRLDMEKDTVDATWLMTSETGSPGGWNSTLVGHDVFRRQTE